MNKVAYTVLTGKGTYTLKDIKFKTPGWRYVCFSTKNIKSKDWEIINIDSSHGLNNKKLSRRVKILNHEYLPNEDISVYFDSKFTIRHDLDKFVSDYLQEPYDMAVMKHNRRNCIYEEEKLLIKLRIDDPKTIKTQVDKYRKSGFPKQKGLYAPGIMIRKHNNSVKDLMECWFSEIEKHSYRDILSLPVCLEKNSVKLSVMPWDEAYNMFRTKGEK